MSDTPLTFGEALYGPNGPASTPQGPTTIDAGKAAPPQSFRGQPISTLPAAADPATVVPNQPANARTLGESLYPTTEAPTTSDRTVRSSQSEAEFTLPDGLEAHPELLSEFGTATRELKLDRAGADKLLALHAKALQGQSSEWRQQSEAAFTTDELTDIRTQFTEAIGTDEDAKTFRQLLARSGIGNHPSAIRVISRLLRR